METKFCQSCGMPLQKNEEFGTNHDGSKNEDIVAIVIRTGPSRWTVRWIR